MSIITLVLSLIVLETKILSLLLISTSLFCLLFFSSDSTLLLWLAFEMASLPMLCSILLFGVQSEKLMAGAYLAAYSLVGGLPLLVMVSLSANLESGWTVESLSAEALILLSLPFMVKLPVYSLHLWLPLAHVEAPTASSMVLAATMLKLGSLGLLHMVSSFAFLLSAVCIVGLILVPFLTLMQSDVKCLVAYSSVSHMAMFTFSLTLFSVSSISSSWLLQVSHGFISSALFLLMGSMSHFLGSRLLYYSSYDDYSSLFLLSAFNFGAPLSLAFMSEVWFYSNVLSFSLWCFMFLVVPVISVTYYNLYFFISTVNSGYESSSLLKASSLAVLAQSVNLMLLLC